MDTIKKEHMSIERHVIEQNNNRARWSEHDTPEQLTRFIVGEAGELEEAVAESLVTGDVFSVASEIGDVGYLLYKLCEMTGLNLEQCIELKLFRNAYKYADYVVGNERDYDDSTRTAKEVWKALGGDGAFSKVYLDYLAHD